MMEFEETIYELFNEVSDCVSIGESVFVRLEDGTSWRCLAADIDLDVKWYPLSLSQIDMLDRMLMSEADRVELDDRAAKVEAKLEKTECHTNGSVIELSMMEDYTGSQEAYNEEYMGGAFDKPISWGFNV